MYSMALDNSWLVMNEDEMYDVNGGSGIDVYYFSHGELGALVGAAFMSGVISYSAALAAVTLLTASVAVVPVLGWAAAAYIGAHAGQFAYALVEAAFSGKGIMIVANTFWGVPNGTFSFDVR